MTDTPTTDTPGANVSSDPNIENNVTPPAAASTATDNDDDFFIDMSKDDEDSLSDIVQNSPEAKNDEYTISFNEELKVSDDVGKMYTQFAKDADIPADKASKFLNSAISGFYDLQRQEQKKEREQLKADWGKDYERNLQKTQSYIKRVAKREGFSQEQVNLLCTPIASRLIFGFVKNFGESRAVGTNAAASTNVVTKSPKEQMYDIMHNRNNPFHNGLINPNAPLKERKAAVTEYNRLAGKVIFDI